MFLLKLLLLLLGSRVRVNYYNNDEYDTNNVDENFDFDDNNNNNINIKDNDEFLNDESENNNNNNNNSNNNNAKLIQISVTRKLAEDSLATLRMNGFVVVVVVVVVVIVVIILYLLLFLLILFLIDSTEKIFIECLTRVIRILWYYIFLITNTIIAIYFIL